MNKKSIALLLAIILFGSNLMGVGATGVAKEESPQVVTFINIHNG
ncbi:hypothetical protein [Listeria booriae]|nr:hypothetical protein [Listeria booriae]